MPSTRTAPRRSSADPLPRRSRRVVVAGLVGVIIATLVAQPAIAATSQNGITLSVDEGQTLSGTVNLTATDSQSGEPLTISIDGVEQPAAAAPVANLVFQAHGWEMNTLNTFIINGEQTLTPMTRYWDWASASWSIPAGVLQAGANTIELRAGSTTMVQDPAPNANDDFRVRNVGLRFSDGTTLTDPAFGTNVAVDMGDGSAAAKLSNTWTIQVPQTRIVASVGYAWNTDVVAPGEHVVTATSADGLRSASATVRIGHWAPAPERVVLTPAEDAATAQSFTWRTGSATADGAVRIREAGSTAPWRTVDAHANDAITSDGVATRTHSATVTGLTPATRYEYSVGSDDATSDLYEFTTAGDANDPFTFIYFGDAQNDLTEKWAPVVDAAYERYPDAVGTVNAGDLIDASRNDSEWTEWFDAMDGHSQTSNVIAAPGNHEYVGDTFLTKWKSNFEYPANGPAWDGTSGPSEGEIQEAAYREQIAKSLTETVYFTDYQGVRFISLNASRNEAGDLYTPADLPACSIDCPDPKKLWLDMQGEWLDLILEENPNRWAVAVFHQPVFSTAVGRDEADLRAAWLPVFQRGDIDLVLMGHDHTYARGFVNSDATSTAGVTTGPVYAVAMSGPKYYEQQPADDNVWTRNGATQVKAAGHTSTFQGITVDGNELRYEAIVAAKDAQSTTSVPIGGTLDAFTITKYPSGWKFVTEDGVQVPADPGTPPEEPEESGISFSIPNGSRLSGTRTVSATDAWISSPVTISLDGVPQQTTPASQAYIAFEAHGYLASAKNTIVINDQWKIVPGVAYNSYATGRFPIPLEALHPGTNKIEFYTGSNVMMNDPATDGANDDFNVRNLRLEFSDGTTATDPGMSPTAIANLGDNGGNHRSWQWDIVAPADKLVSGTSVFEWDTTTAEYGAHELTATSADGTRETNISVFVDNHERVTLNLEDGDLLTGLTPVTITTDTEPVLEIDGAEVPVELRHRAVNPVFAFEGDGFQPDAMMNSIWINGELFRVLGVPQAAHGWKTVEIEIPWDELNPGTNTIRIRSGGNLDPEGSPVDVFSTRNSRLELSGDRVVTDPAHPATETLGYSNNARFADFTFTVPEAWESVYQYDWNTALANDGLHAVKASRDDGRSVADAEVTLDNSGPAIAIGAPISGGDYAKSSFIVDATAADVHDVASLKLAIDGEPVSHGQTITADDLRDGAHVFVAEATDTLGNVSTRSIDFTTTGNYPLAPTGASPVAGATDVDPRNAELSAVVADPSADRLDVALRWGYRGDFVAGATGATQGASTTAVPSQSAGTELGDDERAALATADGETVTTTGDAAYPFQQYEIAVPENLGAETFEVEWTGSVPTTQRAALSVWNHTSGSWQLVAAGTGGDLTLTGEVSVADTVREGSARLMVQDVASTVIAEGDDTAVWAWISDTQFYSQDGSSTYQKQMQWVLDNLDAERIGYGLHTGDIVNNRLISEWQFASDAQTLWDEADFPYGIVPGNHDVDGDGGYANYKRFFGEQRYADNPWYGGSHDDNVQHYDIVSTPGADYLIVFVDWLLDEADIAWANEVIQAHADANVIVATHQYLTETAGYVHPGQIIFDRIVAPNPNVDVVLSGHIGIELLTKQANGRQVLEVMADYQSAPNGGDGWMRLIEFDAEAQTFSNSTFSPTRPGTYWKNDAKENFTLPMTIEAPARWVSTDYVGVAAFGDEAVATFDDVQSGTRVSAPAGELSENTRYSWYVEATDSDGFTTASELWDFTTGEAGPVEPGDELAPVITAPESSVILEGAPFDPLAGVTALDAVDGNVTGSIRVDGAGEIAAPGRYVLTYSVEDAAGNEATRERIVTVVPASIDGLLEDATETTRVDSVGGDRRSLEATVGEELAEVELNWVVYSDPQIIGQAASAPDGALPLAFGTALPTGPHHLVGFDDAGAVVTWAGFAVAAAPGVDAPGDGIAMTGAEVGGLVAIAIILLVLGAVAIVLRSRRTRLS